MKNTSKIEVYRFGDSVALNIPENSEHSAVTLYLNSVTALDLSRLLLNAGHDCIHHKFTASILKPKTTD